MMGTTKIADMNAFASTVKQMLEQAHPSADVEIQRVNKNNNRMLTGIAIYEAGSNISPNILRISLRNTKQGDRWMKYAIQ